MPILMPECKILVKFLWDVDQVGKVRGTFITTRGALAESYGERVSFGDILGKHSEVSGLLKEADFTVITDDQDFIEKFEKYIGPRDGYNPLDKI